MRGKVCLVTGATSGIGRATAIGLARLGATVVLVARDQAKGAGVAAEIRTATGNDKIDVLLADLSAQASIRHLAGRYRQTFDRLHVLVNNAGGFFGRPVLTADGLEMTFALNHLAYFLLTNLLLDVLGVGAPARIVNVTSGAQRAGKIDFTDLQGERSYRPQRSYTQSKLANVLFSYELARRLSGSGITVNCVEPGAVRTNFGREHSTWWMRFMVTLLGPLMRSPEQGAETVLYLAASPEMEDVTGKHFINKNAVPSAPLSYDLALARRLWEVSEELTRER